jgi:excisionase family DNA binding protein
MTTTVFATLDPTDPEVRAAAKKLAARLAQDSSTGTEVNRVVHHMLTDLAQGERVMVLRAEADLTPARAAEVIGVTRQFVDRLLANGVLAFHRLPGSRHRRIKASDVLTLVAERDRERTGHAAILDALADAGILDGA